MIPDGLVTALEFLCYAAGGLFFAKAFVTLFRFIAGEAK